MAKCWHPDKITAQDRQEALWIVTQFKNHPSVVCNPEAVATMAETIAMSLHMRSNPQGDY